MEIEFTVLKDKLSELNHVIYKNEQNICKLTNENIHLKSRVNELEKKLLSKDKSSIATAVNNHPEVTVQTCLQQYSNGDRRWEWKCQ